MQRLATTSTHDEGDPLLRHPPPLAASRRHELPSSRSGGREGCEGNDASLVSPVLLGFGSLSGGKCQESARSGESLEKGAELDPARAKGGVVAEKEGWQSSEDAPSFCSRQPIRAARPSAGSAAPDSQHLSFQSTLSSIDTPGNPLTNPSPSLPAGGAAATSPSSSSHAAPLSTSSTNADNTNSNPPPILHSTSPQPKSQPSHLWPKPNSAPLRDPSTLMVHSPPNLDTSLSAQARLDAAVAALGPSHRREWPSSPASVLRRMKAGEEELFEGEYEQFRQQWEEYEYEYEEETPAAKGDGRKRRKMASLDADEGPTEPGIASQVKVEKDVAPQPPREGSSYLETWSRPDIDYEIYSEVVVHQPSELAPNKWIPSPPLLSIPPSIKKKAKNPRNSTSKTAPRSKRMHPSEAPPKTVSKRSKPPPASRRTKKSKAAASFPTWSEEDGTVSTSEVDSVVEVDFAYVGLPGVEKEPKEEGRFTKEQKGKGREQPMSGGRSRSSRKAASSSTWENESRKKSRDEEDESEDEDADMREEEEQGTERRTRDGSEGATGDEEEGEGGGDVEMDGDDEGGDGWDEDIESDGEEDRMDQDGSDGSWRLDGDNTRSRRRNASSPQSSTLYRSSSSSSVGTSPPTSVPHPSTPPPPSIHQCSSNGQTVTVPPPPPIYEVEDDSNDSDCILLMTPSVSRPKIQHQQRPEQHNAVTPHQQPAPPPNQLFPSLSKSNRSPTPPKPTSNLPAALSRISSSSFGTVAVSSCSSSRPTFQAPQSQRPSPLTTTQLPLQPQPAPPLALKTESSRSSASPAIAAAPSPSTAFPAWLSRSTSTLLGAGKSEPTIPPSISAMLFPPSLIEHDQATTLLKTFPTPSLPKKPFPFLAPTLLPVTTANLEALARTKLTLQQQQGLQPRLFSPPKPEPSSDVDPIDCLPPRSTVRPQASKAASVSVPLAATSAVQTRPTRHSLASTPLRLPPPTSPPVVEPPALTNACSPPSEVLVLAPTAVPLMLARKIVLAEEPAPSSLAAMVDSLGTFPPVKVEGPLNQNESVKPESSLPPKDLSSLPPPSTDSALQSATVPSLTAAPVAPPSAIRKSTRTRSNATNTPADSPVNSPKPTAPPKRTIRLLTRPIPPKNTPPRPCDRQLSPANSSTSSSSSLIIANPAPSTNGRRSRRFVTTRSTETTTSAALSSSSIPSTEAPAPASAEPKRKRRVVIKKQTTAQIIDVSLGPGLPIQSVVRDLVDNELYRCDKWGEKQDSVPMEVVESSIVPGLWVLREKIFPCAVDEEDKGKEGKADGVAAARIEEKKPFKRGAFKDRPRKKPKTDDGTPVGSSGSSGRASSSAPIGLDAAAEMEEARRSDLKLGAGRVAKRKSWGVDSSSGTSSSEEDSDGNYAPIPGGRLPPLSRRDSTPLAESAAVETQPYLEAQAALFQPIPTAFLINALPTFRKMPISIPLEHEAPSDKNCHQCRRHVPSYKRAACKTCEASYCEMCVAKRYDLDIKTLFTTEPSNCPRCLRFCNCSFCLFKWGYRGRSDAFCGLTIGGKIAAVAGAAGLSAMAFLDRKIESLGGIEVWRAMDKGREGWNTNGIWKPKVLPGQRKKISAPSRRTTRGGGDRGIVDVVKRRRTTRGGEADIDPVAANVREMEIGGKTVDSDGETVGSYHSEEDVDSDVDDTPHDKRSIDPLFPLSTIPPSFSSRPSLDTVMASTAAVDDDQSSEPEVEALLNLSASSIPTSTISAFSTFALPYDKRLPIPEPKLSADRAETPPLLLGEVEEGPLGIGMQVDGVEGRREALGGRADGDEDAEVGEGIFEAYLDDAIHSPPDEEESVDPLPTINSALSPPPDYSPLPQPRTSHHYSSSPSHSLHDLFSLSSSSSHPHAPPISSCDQLMHLTPLPISRTRNRSRTSIDLTSSSFNPSSAFKPAFLSRKLDPHLALVPVAPSPKKDHASSSSSSYLQLLGGGPMPFSSPSRPVSPKRVEDNVQRDEVGGGGSKLEEMTFGIEFGLDVKTEEDESSVFG